MRIDFLSAPCLSSITTKNNPKFKHKRGKKLTVQNLKNLGKQFSKSILKTEEIQELKLKRTNFFTFNSDPTRPKFTNSNNAYHDYTKP